VPRARILAALLAVVTLVHAQDQQPRPTFRTEANYVRVDAYPTKSGAPVGDLTREEFEILDNGQPQKIEQFERILIRGNIPQDARREPNTVEEGRRAAQDPRARVFVLFLDTYHVDVAASRQIRRPLTEMLDRMLGPDDVIAVMTPEMSPRDMAFARKTTTIAGFLDKYWHWGERDRGNPIDSEDSAYGYCYPNVPAQDRCSDQNGVAAEMIDRRHEVRTLGALEDLVRYLRGVREERKAILAVSNGWLLFRPNLQLMRPLNCEGLPSLPEVGIDPRTGRPTTKDPNLPPTQNSCSIDRANLAQIDDDRLFRDIQDEANRANASFYTIDPRGLAAFDTTMMRMDVPGPPPPPVPVPVDAAMGRGRITTLRTLAETTDGMAIVNTNDLVGGLRRVVDDLSSYYLLGYYSSGKLDGKFHSITVKVKRPGVQVRARRGYLAATTAPAGTAEPGTGPTKAETEAAAVAAAVGPLVNYSRDAPLRTQVAAGWTSGETSAAGVWVVGELGASAETGDVSRGAAEVSVDIARPDGQIVASVRTSIAVGARVFRVKPEPLEPLTKGEYRAIARVRAGGLPSSDTIAFSLPAAPDATGTLWVRRGPASGNRDVPTADLRFRRSEQLRVEVPGPSTDPATGRLLDRFGKALALPVSVGQRSDPDGSRWVTAQLALAPLAPADYVIELSQGSTRTLAAFRVIP
jgi:VWFA-related protein